MRDHITAAVDGLTLDLGRLNEAIDVGTVDAIIPAGMDLLDRTSLERAWLRDQPLSAILDDTARTVLNRYRMLVTRADLLGERYLLTLDAEHVVPWVDALVEVAGVRQFLELLPE